MKRKLPADWPIVNGRPADARAVPIEELSIEELRYCLQLAESEEYIDGRARMDDAIARGLIPGIPPRPHQAIDALKGNLTIGQLELLRWLAERPNMSAPLADVVRYRSKPQRRINAEDEHKERMYCRRLNNKLVDMNASVQLDIVRGKRMVSLVIRATVPR
jgi:hypothetical protein